MTERKTVYLVDASIYIFRAWHSMDVDFTDREGNPVNAVFGYVGFLLTLLEQTQAKHIVVAFDESLTTSFRNDLYPPYKANRDPAPEELKRQFGYCKDVTAALGITVMRNSEFEADDLIGSCVVNLRDHGFRSVIVSADKDLTQLVGEHDEFWDFARNHRFGHLGVIEKMGVRSDQVADFLALTGDSVDNIPGVPGVGPKTATVLLQHFDNLEAIIERVEEIPFLRMRGAASAASRIKEHQEQARLFAKITRIALHAPVPEADAVSASAPDTSALESLFEQLNFGPMTRRRCRDYAQRLGTTW